MAGLKTGRGAWPAPLAVVGAAAHGPVGPELLEEHFLRRHRGHPAARGAQTEHVVPGGIRARCHGVEIGVADLGVQVRPGLLHGDVADADADLDRSQHAQQVAQRDGGHGFLCGGGRRGGEDDGGAGGGEATVDHAIFSQAAS